jgi:hypothetical protein
VSGLTEGYYQIQEQPKSGVQTDPTPQVVAVFAGNNLPGSPNTVPVATFNNVQLFRIVAFACDMQDKLHPTNVSMTVNNALLSGTTLSAADLTSWDAGVSESHICHLEPNGTDVWTAQNATKNNGGNFPNLLPASSYSPTLGPLP